MKVGRPAVFFQSYSFQNLKQKKVTQQYCFFFLPTNKQQLIKLLKNTERIFHVHPFFFQFLFLLLDVEITRSGSVVCAPL